MVFFMVIQLDVDLRKCPLQFFIAVCPYIQDPRLLETILNIAKDIYVEKKENPEDFDKVYWDLQDLFEIITKNRYANESTMKKMAQIPEFLTRASIAQYTRFSSVLDILMDDDYIIVLCSALQNPLLERKHFNKMFNRTVQSKIDYKEPDNLDYIGEKDWIEKLMSSKFATNDQKKHLKFLLGKIA